MWFSTYWAIPTIWSFNSLKFIPDSWMICFDIKRNVSAWMSIYCIVPPELSIVDRKSESYFVVISSFVITCYNINSVVSQTVLSFFLHSFVYILEFPSCLLIPVSLLAWLSFSSAIFGNVCFTDGRTDFFARFSKSWLFFLSKFPKPTKSHQYHLLGCFY